MDGPSHTHTISARLLDGCPTTSSRGALGRQPRLERTADLLSRGLRGRIADLTAQHQDDRSGVGQHLHQVLAVHAEAQGRNPPQDVLSYRVLQYRPIVYYGGWGIKGKSSDRAYSVHGDRGVKIALTDGNQIMIGSQRPGDIKLALDALTWANRDRRADD